MSKEKRYLITTADELTWKFDRPVIFLGEWCRLYDRKHIWQSMDAIVVEPYGLGKVKKDDDYAEARALEEKLFPVLCEVLNQHHGLQHSERFWRIFLGHWLRRYVDVMLNRVKTLEQCFQAHQILGTTVYSNDHYSLATPESYSAVWAFNDDRWNNAMNRRILDLLPAESCPVEVIGDCESTGFSFNVLATTLTLKRTVLKWGYQQVGKLLSWLARDSDAFIINSFLPKNIEIKLQLALRQYPQLWVSPKLVVMEKPDKALRKDLTKQLVSKSDDNLEDILFAMVFELLPVCYLEGFDNLSKLVKRQSWPKSPKFIFTSNNFDTDEVFKLWAATKVESGYKYFTGQHGNNYGTYRYMYPSVEEATADKFFTWGWTDGLPQHTPAFVFKTVGRKAENYNLQGGLLLIEDCKYHRLDTWDRSAEHLNYFANQVEFTQKLLEHPLTNLTIRLLSSHVYNNPFEKEIWHSIIPDVKIDTGKTNIHDLIAQSRLVVHGYDSTGILQTLSQNIPTLAFWQDGFDHLRESAKPYYQLLVDAGIVHLTAGSVAQKVNEVWDNVDGWWAQSEVQDAREKFCERYARGSENPVQDMKDILTSSNQ